VDPHTGTVFVTDSESGAGTVSVILASNVIPPPVRGLDSMPVAVAVGNGTVYAVGPPASAAAGNNGTVAVITRSPTPTTTPPTVKNLPPMPTVMYGVTATVPVGNTPNGVAVDPDKHAVYVTNYFGDPSDPFGTVSVIKPLDGSSYDVQTVRVGKNPDSVAVDPDKHVVYVTNDLAQGTVSVIDADPDSPTYNQAVGSPIVVGNKPCSVAVDPVTHTVYVASCADEQDEQKVWVIKPR